MTSESALQSMIRIEGPKTGVRLWRNNSGALYDEGGRLIRYGLGNDSAQVNKKLKSPDLVGITPVTITPDMVGQTVGIFTGIEVKQPGWHLTPGDNRAQAQATFMKIIQQTGGYAGFAQSLDDFRRIIRR